MQQFILEILEGLLSNAMDNHNRAARQFLRYSAEQMAKPYDESGATCQYVLDTYKDDVRQLEKAMIWLKGKEK